MTATPVRSSNDSTLAMRSRLKSSSAASGTDPPTRPVLPPCGTIAMPLLTQYRAMHETWRVVVG